MKSNTKIDAPEILENGVRVYSPNNPPPTSTNGYDILNGQGIEVVEDDTYAFVDDQHSGVMAQLIYYDSNIDERDEDPHFELRICGDVMSIPLANEEAGFIIFIQAPQFYNTTRSISIWVYDMANKNIRTMNTIKDIGDNNLISIYGLSSTNTAYYHFTFQGIAFDL